MKVLVACEFSGRVREAFTKKGHDATSCDLLDTEVPGKHYIGDIKDILYQDWDLIIAHPPCTYLAHSGVRWLTVDPERKEKMVDAASFFNLFLTHPCKHIAIENPIMHSYGRDLLHERKAWTQKVQPYMFGHPEKKATCFWLKNLPKLKVTDNVESDLIGMQKGDTDKVLWEPPGPDRWKNRSRTYLGVAEAMAEQWGSYISRVNCA